MADVSKIILDGTSINIKDATARQLIEDLQNTLYPIGHIIMNNSCDTEAKVIAKYGGTHWTQITDRCIVGAGSTYTQGTTGGSATNSHTHSVTTNGTVGNHTLTTEELPAHNHSLNSHTHSIPALSGSTNSTGSHTHKLQNDAGGMFANKANETGYGIQVNGVTTSYDMALLDSASAGAHSHTVTTNANTSGQASGNTGNAGSGTAHNHTFTGSAVTSGGASNTNNMQPYIAEYIWQRVS